MNTEYNSTSPSTSVEYNPSMALFWILLLTGVGLFLFSEAFANTLATKQGFNTTYVDAVAASRYVVKIYMLAGVSVLLALVERIALEIRALRKA